MKQIIDIHSHMLPCVDDGCESTDEAYKMLKMYEDQNVEAVICTPHFGPCGIKGANVKKAYSNLSSVNCSVKLYLGNEILFDRFTLANVKKGYACTLAGSEYVLVEFEDWLYPTPTEDILNGMKHLLKGGFRPILAHPERYKKIQVKPEFCKRLRDSGIELQINCYDICETDNITTKNATQYLLKNQIASYIGSDAHGAVRRKPLLKNGVLWIYENCDEKYADSIVHDNAKKIIGGA